MTATVRTAHSKAVVEQLLHYVASGEVVDLAKLLRLRRLLDQLAHASHQEGVLPWLHDLLSKNGEQLYLLMGWYLLKWVEEATEICARQGMTDAHSVAAWMVERPYTWRISRAVRLYFADIHDVPHTDVSAHLRRGRRVRTHRRLLGNDHLRALPVSEWPPIVGEVIRIMAERVSF